MGGQPEVNEATLIISSSSGGGGSSSSSSNGSSIAVAAAHNKLPPQLRQPHQLRHQHSLPRSLPLQHRQPHSPPHKLHPQCSQPHQLGHHHKLPLQLSQPPTQTSPQATTATQSNTPTTSPKQQLAFLTVVAAVKSETPKTEKRKKDVGPPLARVVASPWGRWCGGAMNPWDSIFCFFLENHPTCL